MFRATMCPSSGELTVWVAVWSAGWDVTEYHPNQQPIQGEKYQRHIDAVCSAGDGNIVAGNM